MLSVGSDLKLIEIAMVEENEQEGGGWIERWKPVIRMAFMWYAIQAVLNNFMAPTPPPTKPQLSDTKDASSAPVAKPVEGILSNAWKTDEPIELRVYISPEEQLDLTALSAADAQQLLRWHIQDGLTYSYLTEPKGSDEGQWTADLNVSIQEDWFANNKSMYAHVYLSKAGVSPERDDPLAVLYKSHPLVTYRPANAIVKKRNLLSSDEDVEEVVEDMHDETYVTMWRPSFVVNVVYDETTFAPSSPPPPFLRGRMHVDKQKKKYSPVLFMNDFWVLDDMLVPVNKSVSTVPLHISFYSLPIYKLAAYTQMQQSFEQQEASGTSSRKDTDSMKRMVLESNPYLLAITFVVSLFHSLFDFLAFKNDVSFWKNQKSLAGISLRTLGLNTFFQVVIFLYLMDNDTSWMILLSSFVSLVIDAWKITKAIKVQKDPETGKWRVDAEESYDASPTAEHDRVAVAHLSFVIYPLIVGQAFYTLTYGVHKGWYSWVISSLTSFVYAFGFVMMTPQLYINYKLKSVAHLPWRAMVYKSLNTFIDDLFAFVITMPWMHRLSCFRDDLIFFIYLYQRWIYPVDAKRTNEYGQGPAPSGAEEDSEPEPTAKTEETEKPDEVKDRDVAQVVDETELLASDQKPEDE